MTGTDFKRTSHYQKTQVPAGYKQHHSTAGHETETKRESWNEPPATDCIERPAQRSLTTVITTTQLPDHQLCSQHWTFLCCFQLCCFLTSTGCKLILCVTICNPPIYTVHTVYRVNFRRLQHLKTGMDSHCVAVWIHSRFYWEFKKTHPSS